jgi:hypothetical protein
VTLKFPPAWRFRPPVSETLNTSTIPDDAIGDFMSLVRKVVTQGDRQEFLEHYKVHFFIANGTTPIYSSNASWAETDLFTAMEEAAANSPLFLEAYYDACEAIRCWPGDLFAPDAEIINEVCRKHGIGYELRPPALILRDANAAVISVPERPPTLAERGGEILTESLRHSEELLEAGRGREAVQETLWLLETVATAFRGMDTGSGTIEGKYFNRIVAELRQAAHGTTLDRALDWATSVHGYLSSPTGGGVRHGLDLYEGLELSPNEARLFCNLMRSFLSYLLSEHQRLTTNG